MAQALPAASAARTTTLQGNFDQQSGAINTTIKRSDSKITDLFDRLEKVDNKLAKKNEEYADWKGTKRWGAYTNNWLDKTGGTGLSGTERAVRAESKNFQSSIARLEKESAVLNKLIDSTTSSQVRILGKEVDTLTGSGRALSSYGSIAF